MVPVDRDLELRLLLEAVYAKYHYDFRGYAFASLKRRLARALDVLGCRTLSGLQEQLLHNPATFPRLLPFLTVQVSDMFRDPSYYRLLRDHVVPLLRTYPALKLWVAGCSCGEEVYSLAILLHEEQLLERSLIYATDIDPDSLMRAQSGIYELDRVAAWSQSYQESGGRGSLSDYYTAAYGAAAFDKALRKNVVFSDHSLATDSVFAEVQLVSCRNVLIYFNRALQDRAVGLFADALCEHGFLGLGSKESLYFTSHAARFEQLSPEARVYRRLGA
jgi:chemotaxis protein methyltransferase CheR